MKLVSLSSWPCVTLAAMQLTVSGQHLVFSLGVDAKQFATTDAIAYPTNSDGVPALHVTTGTQHKWPGITFAASHPMDLSRYAEVSIELKNRNSKTLTIFCRVDNPGADGTKHCVTGSATIPPGETGTVQVPLKRTADDKLQGKLFGMRGYPVKGSGSGSIDAANITQVLLFVSDPKERQEFEVRRLVASGEYTPPTAWTSDADPFFPLIDTFGQYRHKKWPGKVASLEDLRARRVSEEKELTNDPGPEFWDKFGGWKNGSRREATGFFRVEKLQGKWWLVDPEGALFFSHGVDCVRMLDTTPIDERDNWFQKFPGKEPLFAEFISRGYALKGHYAGKSAQCFSFAGANLLRKYGPDWKRTYPQVIQQRLRSWGINTIANWSDEGIRLLRRTPYTDSIGSSRARMLEGSEGYWGKFPDVFDASFAEGLRRQMAAKRDRSAGDPWCIGYFSDNEMSWGDEVSLSVAALKSPPSQRAKQVFLEDLKARYGTVEKLNNTWSSTYQSWEALLDSREAPDLAKARKDLETFYSKCSDQYFRTVRDAIREVAPKQLYLGCRFAWVNARAAASAAKYCDVVSYNLYRRSVADFQFNGGADVPLIIGEFHFGALDRGMFHTGLVPVGNQQSRAQAYKDYVKGALKHPQFVGTHWFQYQDEPATGRVYDEEKYQIGLVDIADTPYAETIRAVREVGYHLYDSLDLK